MNRNLFCSRLRFELPCDLLSYIAHGRQNAQKREWPAGKHLLAIHEDLEFTVVTADGFNFDVQIASQRGRRTGGLYAGDSIAAAANRNGHWNPRSSGRGTSERCQRKIWGEDCVRGMSLIRKRRFSLVLSGPQFPELPKNFFWGLLPIEWVNLAGNRAGGEMMETRNSTRSRGLRV
jgi:hypothetical protein